MAAPLRHALWIGGPPGAGKTMVATRIARRHGLRWYGADPRTWEHRDRALASGHPAAHRWEALSPAERWERATPADLLQMSLHAARGPMVLDDVGRLPSAPLAVAEGSPVSPAFVTSGAALRSQTVWLLPEPELLRRRLDERDLPRGARELYLMLASEIEREAKDHDVPVLRPDETWTIGRVVAELEERFAGVLAAGPRAETTAERRALLREANEAIAAQVRGYLARGWAEADAVRVVRELACECGSPECGAIVVVDVRDLSRKPLLAPGHA